jgi:Uma2 family endonuclease
VIRKKIDDHLDARTGVVWLVDLDERGVEVRAPGAQPWWVAEDGTLDGGAALPDLRLRVADLFADVARES